MAIEKNKTLPNGISGNYWKIVSHTVNRITNVCSWNIALFKDKDASDSNKRHLGIVKTFSKKLIDQELAQDVVAIGYNHIKTKSSTMIAFVQNDPSYFDKDLADGKDV